uniref:Uncharacterized protein n=1 Tax=Knipowitschia caucasica TaxID=637954 RepID=A0AAV2MJZ8_KNICA
MLECGGCYVDVLWCVVVEKLLGMLVVGFGGGDVVIWWGVMWGLEMLWDLVEEGIGGVGGWGLGWCVMEGGGEICRDVLVDDGDFMGGGLDDGGVGLVVVDEGGGGDMDWRFGVLGGGGLWGWG